jgi:hypothetical protein
VDVSRRSVLVRWLRDAGYAGSADDLEHADTGHAAAMAYEIADQVEEDCRDDDAELVCHLRGWADQHEKLERGTL